MFPDIPTFIFRQTPMFKTFSLFVVAIVNEIGNLLLLKPDDNAIYNFKKTYRTFMQFFPELSPVEFA